MRRRDDQIGLARDLAERGDPRGFGAVVGHRQRHAQPHPGEIGDQCRGGFMGMDQIDRVGLQPAAQSPGRPPRRDQARGDRSALARDVFRRQVQEIRLRLRVGPCRRRSAERDPVPLPPHPIAQGKDVARDAAHAELRLHFQHMKPRAVGSVLRHLEMPVLEIRPRHSLCQRQRHAIRRRPEGAATIRKRSDAFAIFDLAGARPEAADASSRVTSPGTTARKKATTPEVP